MGIIYDNTVVLRHVCDLGAARRADLLKSRPCGLQVNTQKVRYGERRQGILHGKPARQTDTETSLVFAAADKIKLNTEILLLPDGREVFSAEISTLAEAVEDLVPGDRAYHVSGVFIVRAAHCGSAHFEELFLE